MRTTKGHAERIAATGPYQQEKRIQPSVFQRSLIHAQAEGLDTDELSAQEEQPRSLRTPTI
jgi:hypothetical protein